MEHPSLRHLHAFYAVATTGGIRRSSETLYRASSAIARSVATLEATLGVQLFERKGRGMLLTSAGEAVRLRTERIEAEMQAVRADALRLRPAGSSVGGVEALLNERRLEAAALVAEVHHLPTVARTLGSSQSAISQAIARLEDMLAQPLFARTARGMTPTEAGAGFIERFERILAELRHITEDVAALSGEVMGIVKIGALPLARTQLLPLAIARVVSRHPRLQVRSFESPYEELTAGLLSGRLDFIVGAMRGGDSAAFTSHDLFVDCAVLAARHGHPLTRKQVLDVADIQAYPWVLSRPGTPLRVSLERAFAARQLAAPQPAVETGDLTLLRGLLLSSDMLTVLSAHQLHHELATQQLTVLPFALDGMERTIGVTTRNGAQLSPGAKVLIAEIDTLAQRWR